MVGRLVQQKQLGRVEQQACQRDTPPLAAREPVDRGVHAGGKALQPDAAHQPVEHAAKRPIRRPFVLGALADERIAQRRVGVELVLLAEQRHANVAGTSQRACVGRLGAGDQPQQGGLAAAVLSDHADALAGGDSKRDLAQHRAAAVPLLDILEIDQVARRCHPVHRGGSHSQAAASVGALKGGLEFRTCRWSGW